MLRLIYGAVVLALAVAFCGCTEHETSGDRTLVGDNLVSDVEKLRKTDHRTNINITALAGKYFPIGSSKTAAENELKRLGFTAELMSSTSSTSYVKNLQRTFISADEIRIVLTYADGRVSSVAAALVHQSL